MRDGLVVRHAASSCDVNLGDLVTYRGRVYILRGLDPMSVPRQRAVLEDPRTGRRRTAPYAEVRERVGSAEPSLPAELQERARGAGRPDGEGGPELVPDPPADAGR